MTKLSCIASLCIGVMAAVFAFTTKNPANAIIAGAVAAAIGIISLIIGRKSTDDMQLAVAGIFMSIVSCLVGLWQQYH